jgi:hypothetical protein
MRVLDQKLDTYFFKSLGDAQKSNRGANCSFFNKVGTTIYEPTQ